MTIRTSVYKAHPKTYRAHLYYNSCRTVAASSTLLIHYPNKRHKYYHASLNAASSIHSRLPHIDLHIPQQLKLEASCLPTTLLHHPLPCPGSSRLPRRRHMHSRPSTSRHEMDTRCTPSSVPRTPRDTVATRLREITPKVLWGR